MSLISRRHGDDAADLSRLSGYARIHPHACFGTRVRAQVAAGLPLEGRPRQGPHSGCTRSEINVLTAPSTTTSLREAVPRARHRTERRGGRDGAYTRRDSEYARRRDSCGLNRALRYGRRRADGDSRRMARGHRSRHHEALGTPAARGRALASGACGISGVDLLFESKTAECWDRTGRSRAGKENRRPCGRTCPAKRHSIGCGASQNLDEMRRAGVERW